MKRRAVLTAAVAAAAGLLVLALAVALPPAAVPTAAPAINEEAEYSWFFKPAKGGEQPGFSEVVEILPDYNAVAVGSPDVKSLYLTFDSGYEDGSMGAILDTLKEKNVTAAFFVTGHYVRSAPDMVKRMAEEGHLVCNHSDGHKKPTKLTRDEFAQELDSLVRECAAIDVDVADYYRPPEGVYSLRTLNYAKELGYTTVFWSFAYVDWYQNDQPSHSYAISNFLSRMHPGAIVLLHSTSATNAAVLPTLIDECRSRGYEFCPLSSLPA